MIGSVITDQGLRVEMRSDPLVLVLVVVGWVASTCESAAVSDRVATVAPMETGTRLNENESK